MANFDTTGRRRKIRNVDNTRRGGQNREMDIVFQHRQHVVLGDQLDRCVHNVAPALVQHVSSYTRSLDI